MDFEHILDQAIDMLQRRGRVTYRALKRQFQLDDSGLADLKTELLYTHAQVADDEGVGLIWTGDAAPGTDRRRRAAEDRFYALLPEVIDRLRSQRRVTYRTLQYLYGADAALLAAMREELAFRRLAIDEDGKGLVWVEAAAIAVDAPANEPATRREPTPSVAEAERRQLTVMFCDLVGSTDLSGRLDPEAWREVVRAYQEMAAGVIERYEGHIAQYLGDGLLVYFGYPVAHEDDAQRAVHTGLGIVEAMGALNPRLEADYGVTLAVRVGIHTGAVVVGEMGGGGRHEHLALGETPNIAARLEGLASPNAVVISLVTMRLAQRVFTLQDLGPYDLKGVAEPMRLYAVIGVREGEPDDHEGLLAGGFEALVGRDEEIGLLRRRWEQSKDGQGQVVLISGEAGLGKSSLVEGMRAQARQEGAAHVACTHRVSGSGLAYGL